MKSVYTLSKNLITSLIKFLSSFHSSYFSEFKEDRQHTAVLSLPSLSIPVGKVISLHRFDVLTVKTSNLCSEITLPTGVDKEGRDRTAVCCLSSLNLEKYDEWKEDKNFVKDVMRFLDNVLNDFIEKAPEEFSDATYSAMRERSVGLGVMGMQIGSAHV